MTSLQNRPQQLSGSKIFLIILLIILLTFVSFSLLKPAKPTSNKKFIFSGNGIYVYETENGGKSLRCLTFSPKEALNGLNQGCIFKKYPKKLVFDYTKFMIKATMLAEKKESILMLGMGIGTIPKALSENLPNAKIDIVEIIPEMPKIAEEFFYFKKTDNMNIFIEDAYSFVLNAALQSKAKYDIILMDIFDETYIPHQFLTEEFMLKLKHLLKPEGKLIVNTFSNSPNYEMEEELIGKFYKFQSEMKTTNRIMIVSENPH